MKIRSVLILLALIFLSNSANAGLPTVVDKNDTGVPYRWANGTVEVWFDKGDLSESITNSVAIKIVEEAWKKWEDATLPLTGPNDLKYVTKGSLRFVNKGHEPNIDDINVSTYLPYINNNSKYSAAHHTVIIFDKTGEIMADIICGADEECDPGDVTGILGATYIDELDDSAHTIKNGTIVLNGFAIGDQTEGTVRASILHELGHLINLDHSPLNDPCLDVIDCTTGDTDEVKMRLPTMHYSIVSLENKSIYGDSFGEGHPQYDLHVDDKAWAAYLYNYNNSVSDINSMFCTVTGYVQDHFQHPFQGAQVYAIAVDADGTPAYHDAFASVTGGFYNACAKPTDFASGAHTKKEGRFIITGLRPNTTYQLWISQLPPWINDGSVCSSLAECTTAGSLGSGINPYSPPRDVDSGLDKSYAMKNAVDESADFICTVGGQQLNSKLYTLLVDLDKAQYRYYNIGGDKFECDPLTPGKKVEESGSGSGGSWFSPFNDRFKKGWCSLNPAASASAMDIMWLLIPAMVVAFRFLPSFVRRGRGR